MRDCRSVTTRPSGLESAIALAVSERPARDGKCIRPKANSMRPSAPKNARATTAQVTMVGPSAFGANHAAAATPASASARRASTSGLAVRSIHSHTGGVGVEVIFRLDPKALLDARRVDLYEACATTRPYRCLGG